MQFKMIGMRLLLKLKRTGPSMIPTGLMNGKKKEKISASIGTTSDGS